MFKPVVAQCTDVCGDSMPHGFKQWGQQCKKRGKPIIKCKERGGRGNGQLTACVGGRQEDIFIAGQDKIGGEVTQN